MTEAALDEILRQYDDPQTRERILRIVNATGVRPHDPVFLLMMGVGQVQALLETAPNDLRQTFEQAHQDILGKLDGYEQAARRGVEQQVAQMAQEAIAKAGQSKLKLSVLALAGGGAIALCLLSLGIFLGLGYSRTTTRYAPGGPVQLTLEEAEALKWAQSQEGQYARKIMNWNEDLLGGQCRRQVEGFVEAEGLTIQYGTQEARSGFCLLWIVPPEEREFMKADGS